MPGIDKQCQGEGATHYACDCVLKRHDMLEKDNEELRQKLDEAAQILHTLYASLPTEFIEREQLLIREAIGKKNYSLLLKSSNKAKDFLLTNRK